MITFKEIEIVGFKSFADHTKITFDGGITGIVGPNGCGKSNVSDAICWVLGEQSSKALRSKSMQDVIFAGTEKRKKLGYCEVSLTFDNTNKWFNVDYEEVVITRKLYRNGESEYQLNKKPCRLKDIRDLLYDSGIGKDGYSIIGQGRVEEIIQSKPEERRTIFEEATGIAKFKVRKVETERRLERVRDNLSRANDIAVEVERRLGPLKKQSEDAKKFLEYRDVLKQNEINAYIYDYEHAAQTKFDINEKLVGLRDNLRVLDANLEAEQNRYDASLNRINQLDREATGLHDKVLHHTIELEKRQSDSRLLNEQTKHIKEHLDRLNSQLETANLNLNQRIAIISSCESLRAEEMEHLQKLNKEAQETTDKYMELIDAITKSEGEKEESQRNYIDNLSKLTDIKANLSAYIAKRDTMLENIKGDNQKLADLETERESLNKEFESLKVNVETLEKSKLEKQESTSKTSNELQNLNADLEELNSKIYSLKSSISNDTNRMNILTNLQMDYEGYNYAVKRLMQESKNNPTIKQAVKGVVANIISVEEKYQTAIEIALGGSIQNIVTSDEDDAKVLIQYLKDNRSGRATFLPISAVKSRTLNANDKKYLTSKGCLGVASDLVKTESMFRPVIESLLGATVVCDNMENAVNLARLSGYAFRIVTLDGEILTPQGSMSGGSKKSSESSLLNKDNEIKALKKNIEERSKELETVESQYSACVNKIQQLKALLNKENIEFQEISNEYYSKSSTLDNLKVKLTDLDEDLFSIKSQLKVAQNIVDELNSQINSIDKVESDYKSTQLKVGEFTESNKNAYEELKQRKEEFQQNITTLKVKIASTEEKIRSLDKDLDSFNSDLENTKLQISSLNKEIESQQRVYNEAVALNKTKEDVEDTEKIKNELNEINAELSKFEETKSYLMNELKQLDEKKGSLSSEISRLNNRIYQEETKLQKVDVDIENMQERIYQEYELTYNDCLQYKNQDESFDIKQVHATISQIRNKITSLGYVNVNAIEEYKTEGARYEEMIAQIEDLKKAEEDAVAIIKDLSKEMLDKFNTDFEKIQENFTKVFKELFGGGNARLELLPSEDPLTAGVDIIAQPPGKVISNITLLSGGEKTMTAIAILFAILKLKPMPFCFLDEIEAALDDANIDRYANYLKRFSDDTQFIVITHRKPTMEVVDSLYGVTMEEKGVSKIVSVKLADAVKAIDAK